MSKPRTPVLEPEWKIYAVAVYADRESPVPVFSAHFAWRTGVLAVRARSPAEAVGLGVEQAHSTWPVSEGWRNHAATVSEVPALWYTIREPGA